jgi:hypothetical protein
MFEYSCLAAADLGRAVSDYSAKSKTFSGNYYLFLVVGFIILFWVSLLFKDKLFKILTPSKPASGTLFNDLCVYHRLNRNDIKWLKDLAIINKTDQHAMVFVKPEWFTDNSKKPAGSAKICKRLINKIYGNDWVKENSAS